MKLNGLKNILIALLCLSSYSDALAKDIYAFIKSKELQQIDTVISGFTESFPDAEISMLDLKGEKDNTLISAFIKMKKPSVLICLGSLAANAVIMIEKKIPVIFAMVINYQRQEILQNNVTGISMEIPPETLFTQFIMLMPEVKSIAVPFHPAVSSEIVSDAVSISKKMDLKLIPIVVKNPDLIKENLSVTEKNYSGLWMLADTKLYNRETKALDELLAFSTSRKKSLLAFSEAFLQAGALFSVSINYKSLGSQIALLSRILVQDKMPPSEIPIAPPIGTYTVINKNVAKILLGDKFNESIFEQVDKVYPVER